MNSNTIISAIGDHKNYGAADTGTVFRRPSKDIYIRPGEKLVITIYKELQDDASKIRLEQLVTRFQELGRYRRNSALYQWPADVVSLGKKTGVVFPMLADDFFFSKGYAGSDLIKGKLKKASWLIQAQFRNPDSPLHLDPAETGNWRSYFHMCLQLATALGQLHQAGLVHAGLSDKQVLFDPVREQVCLRGIDQVSIQGFPGPPVKIPAAFMAPELLRSRHLDHNDAKRQQPDLQSDLHALAVLIYSSLLYRHPLRGSHTHDADPLQDELYTFGTHALFTEHPTDHSNRPRASQLHPMELPWADVRRRPYTWTGPYLSPLFEKAFIAGLSDPAQRPGTAAWQAALQKTLDLLQPCNHKACPQQWYIADNQEDPICPFCATRHESLPVLDFYYLFKPGVWRMEDHRMAVYTDQRLFPRHVLHDFLQDEQDPDLPEQAVLSFRKQGNDWILINERLDTLKDLTEDRMIGIGETVTLVNSKRLLLSGSGKGRMIVITI